MALVEVDFLSEKLRCVRDQAPRTPPSSPCPEIYPSIDVFASYEKWCTHNVSSRIRFMNHLRVSFLVWWLADKISFFLAESGSHPFWRVKYLTAKFVLQNSWVLVVEVVFSKSRNSLECSLAAKLYLKVISQWFSLFFFFTFFFFSVFAQVPLEKRHEVRNRLR